MGGVFGALSRHLVGERLDRGTLGTLAVNVLGSVALGAVVVAPVDDGVVLAAGTGFCGAFTTFSSFAFETVHLVERGERERALVVAVANLLGALAGIGVGAGGASALW
jgi:CrcB protein